MSSERNPGSTKRKILRVYDNFGTDYVLKKKLAEGGQGVVCETDRPRMLVKIFRGKDPQAKRRWINQVNWVLNQELDRLHIAFPVAVIQKPWPGYVMELMEGLMPLQDLLDTSHQSLLDGEGLQGFVATGGLGRRLALLRELATTLADLHGRGLAYGDLSPSNCFISSSLAHHQVWLIDCDNLCASERLGHGHIHTPGYGAPEVVRGESGVNTLTDAWSFAVLAFELLTHGHPFKGVAVEDGEPEEMEPMAYRGELPWVYHSEDDSNASVGGIPLELVTTSRMQKLFEDCFNTGRDDPGCRPSLAQWANALDEAWAMTLICPDEACNSSYCLNENEQCPFCEHASPPALVLEHAWFGPDVDPEDPYLETGDRQVIGLGQTVQLRLAPAGTRGYREAPLACTLTLDQDKLMLKPAAGQEHRLVLVTSGKAVPFNRTRSLSVDKQAGREFALHLHNPDAPGLCPVWRFTW